MTPFEFFQLSCTRRSDAIQHLEHPTFDAGILDFKTATSSSVMTIAVESRDVEFVKILIHYGARTRSGLSLALLNGYDDMVAVFLERDVEVEVCHIEYAMSTHTEGVRTLVDRVLKNTKVPKKIVNRAAYLLKKDEDAEMVHILLALALEYHDVRVLSLLFERIPLNRDTITKGLSRILRTPPFRRGSSYFLSKRKRNEDLSGDLNGCVMLLLQHNADPWSFFHSSPPVYDAIENKNVSDAAVVKMLQVPLPIGICVGLRMIAFSAYGMRRDDVFFFLVHLSKIVKSGAGSSCDIPVYGWHQEIDCEFLSTGAYGESPAFLMYFIIRRMMYSLYSFRSFDFDCIDTLLLAGVNPYKVPKGQRVESRLESPIDYLLDGVSYPQFADQYQAVIDHIRTFGQRVSLFDLVRSKIAFQVSKVIARK